MGYEQQVVAAAMEKIDGFPQYLRLLKAWLEAQKAQGGGWRGCDLLLRGKLPGELTPNHIPCFEIDNSTMHRGS